jgi:hypothetical protein
MLTESIQRGDMESVIVCWGIRGQTPGSGDRLRDQGTDSEFKDGPNSESVPTS